MKKIAINTADSILTLAFIMALPVFFCLCMAGAINPGTIATTLLTFGTLALSTIGLISVVNEK